LPDAPLQKRDGEATHLLESLSGGFEVVYVKNGTAAPTAPNGMALTVIGEDLLDRQGLFAVRFDTTPGATYLVRPDQHLCGRWRRFDADAVARARQRALQR
jgi:3-(3-hydroxy-phenyl)propionate hydroxylase